MTTQAAIQTQPAQTARTRPEDEAVPLSRLVSIELRKMVDTRAGRWLVIGLVGLVAVTLGVGAATTDADGRSFDSLLALAQLPTSALLPVLGILAATSEWSKRTVLTTFALTPSRSRVLAAKTAAGLALTLAAVAVTVLFAAVAALIAPLFGTATSDWSVGPSDLGEYVSYQALYMLVGVALGSLLMYAPAAIVFYMLTPVLWTAVTAAFPGLTDVQQWTDMGTAWEQLVAETPMTAQWWARIGTTAIVWLALPLAFGIRRQLRREVD